MLLGRTAVIVTMSVLLGSSFFDDSISSWLSNRSGYFGGVLQNGRSSLFISDDNAREDNSNNQSSKC